MKKQRNKHKVRIGLELNYGFREIKREWDEAVAEPVRVFRKGQQCSIITCRTQVCMILLSNSVALDKRAQALMNS